MNYHTFDHLKICQKGNSDNRGYSSLLKYRSKQCCAACLCIVVFVLSEMNAECLRRPRLILLHDACSHSLNHLSLLFFLLSDRGKCMGMGTTSRS